jgi:glycerol-3-phosphate dehydrogenase
MPPLVRDPRRLAQTTHDVLVIGGGIYGVAVAYDAALRGARTALVEAGDFGGETSWNSLRTIHGGIRHLQSLDLGNFRESVRERRTFLRIAPRIVRPLPFVVPIFEGGEGRKLKAGIVLANLLSPDRSRGLRGGSAVLKGRSLDAGAVRASFPELRGAPRGGIEWTDAQVTHPERLVMALVKGAVRAGAGVANYVEAKEVLRSGGVLAGVRCRDLESGEALEIPARVVVNAAGPRGAEILGVTASKGPGYIRAVNLVLKRPVVREAALGLRSQGRYLFLVPACERALLGTAYGPRDRDPRGLALEFLREAEEAFGALVTGDDVEFVQSGLVPGTAAGLESQTQIAAEDGVVSVVGGKYTSARAAAAAVVERAFALLGRPVPLCRTAAEPLPDAAPLEGSLGEKTTHAVREEMALHLTDVLLRRVDSLRRASPDEAREALAALARERGLGEERAREEHEGWLRAYTTLGLQ